MFLLRQVFIETNTRKTHTVLALAIFAQIQGAFVINQPKNNLVEPTNSSQNILRITFISGKKDHRIEIESSRAQQNSETERIKDPCCRTESLANSLLDV